MDERNFNLAVYIGRFQPLHNAHFEIIKKGLEIADHLLVVIGSRSKERRTTRNPWTSDERKEMIVQSLSKSGVVTRRVHIESVFDVIDDDAAWFEQVHEAIDDVLDKHVIDNFDGYQPEPKVTLIGHVKDASSFYLQTFPGLVYSPVAVSPENRYLNATDIRRNISLGGSLWPWMVPEGTREFLQDWLRTHHLPEE